MTLRLFLTADHLCFRSGLQRLILAFHHAPGAYGGLMERALLAAGGTGGHIVRGANRCLKS